MSLTEGDVFAGFTIVRRLGAGAMGEVYLAQHPRLPRQDALKVLPTALTTDAEFRQRFNREADIAAKLWHPHIVGLHDRGEHEGRLWISMDYVEGKDAADLLKSQFPSGMPESHALAIIEAVAGALDYAHQQGLLHRDVKPANILISGLDTEYQRILLSDFGIARQMDDIGGLTATNMAVGTAAYAAPEQLAGGLVDGRADQYALACTAFHLLTGSPPFSNSNPAVVIGQHLTAPPPLIRDRRLDLAALDPVFHTALAKKPEDRFARCADFAAALAQQLRQPSNGDQATTAAVAPPPVYPYPPTDESYTPSAPYSPAMPSAPPYSPAMPSAPYSPAMPPRSGSRAVIAVLAVLGLVFIAGAAILIAVLLSGNGDDRPASAESSPTARQSIPSGIPTIATPGMPSIPFPTGVGASDARVTVDGNPLELTGPAICVTMSANVSIAIGGFPNSVAAVVTAGDSPKVESVSVTTSDGVKLAYSPGTEGDAKATKDGNKYTITGTAMDLSNPTAQVTKPFEIEVTCQ